MDPKTLQRHLTVNPFKPFKIQTTRAAEYEVTDPSVILLTTQILYIGYNIDPSSGMPKDAYAVPVVQIARII